MLQKVEHSGRICARKSLTLASESCREVEIHRKLQHDNVLQVVAVQDGALIFQLPDQDLQHILAARAHEPSSFPAKMRCEIATGIAAGLAYIHEMQVVHLNLKPSNILLVFGDTCRPLIAGFDSAVFRAPAPRRGIATAEDFAAALRMCRDGHAPPELLIRGKNAAPGGDLDI